MSKILKAKRRGPQVSVRQENLHLLPTNNRWMPNKRVKNLKEYSHNLNQGLCDLGEQLQTIENLLS